MTAIDAAEARALMEAIVCHRGVALPALAFAEIFERLHWAIDDPDGHMLRVREEWLRFGDRERVEISLAYQEIFPFVDRAEMETVFRSVVERWPEFAPRCQELVDARQKGSAQ